MRRSVKADDARRTADARADELKYRLGISDFLLASAAYDNRDVVLAAERLGNVPPDQRGWEWRYLKRLTRGGLFTFMATRARCEAWRSARTAPASSPAVGTGRRRCGTRARARPCSNSRATRAW